MDRASERETVGVVLAAGMGTRMRSERPKVLHEVGGRPMLHWVLDALAASGCSRTLVVIGHGGDAVRQACEGFDVGWVEQREQLGTGHALAQAAPSVNGPATLLVVSGDVPLVSSRTLARLVEAARGAWGALAVATLEEPRSLGRVVTREDGDLDRIVEAADASPGELDIHTVNAGLYALPAPEVFTELAAVGSHNAKGEIYLTDALGRAAAGERLAVVELDDEAEAWGVNDRIELARLHRRMISRHLDRLAEAGVTILDPESTTIDPTVTVGADTVVHPGVHLAAGTRVGAGCELHRGAWIEASEVGDEVVVRPYSVLEGATVASRVAVGPFARLRPGATIGPGSKIGNFVEIKNSRLAAGVKAGHLAYLGDATIGENANIGAGVVTCNYDGSAKHPTEIGDDAFIGSDTMLVAPLRVGSAAVTGAGSVISKDVPDGALAVERAPQRTVEGWSRLRRPKDD